MIAFVVNKNNPSRGLLLNWPDEVPADSSTRRTRGGCPLTGRKELLAVREASDLRDAGVALGHVDQDLGQELELVLDHELARTVEVAAAGAEVGRREPGEGHVEHGAVGAGAHAMQLRGEVAHHQGRESGLYEHRVGLDGLLGGDVHHIGLADDGRDAVAACSLLGHGTDDAREVGNLLLVESTRVDRDDGLAGCSGGDCGHVDEWLVAAAVPWRRDLVELVDEPAGGIMGRLEGLAGDARVGIVAPELNGDLGTAEAADIDDVDLSAVDGPEDVPRLGDLFGQELHAHLADFFVDAEPEGEIAVVGLVDEQIMDERDERGHAGLVVAAQQSAAIGGDDVPAGEALEVRSRDDHAVAGQDDVTAIVAVDDRLGRARAPEVGVEVGGKAHVGGRLELRTRRGQVH